MAPGIDVQAGLKRLRGDHPGQEMATALASGLMEPKATALGVTRGGVDTSELSSKMFESRSVPGSYFIGEVVNFTGHLGGFNVSIGVVVGFAVKRYL